jgi:diphosphomevalonate decarboxylase
MNQHATAWAPINIALIKHWGFGPLGPTEPARPSLSLTLEQGAWTEVAFAPLPALSPTAISAPGDAIEINGHRLSRDGGQKARAAYDFLSRLRESMPSLRHHAALVRSVTEVPVSAGMASSAAGAAALSLAAWHAAAPGAGAPTLPELVNRCATLGSWSGVRSLLGGAVALTFEAGDVVLEQVHTPLELVVFSCRVAAAPKEISSSEGHLRAPSSPYWPAFQLDGFLRFQALRQALEQGDWARALPLIEQDALAMHAVMMSSSPPIFYATDATWKVWQAVSRWRQEPGGPQAACTLDAGANPHLVVPAADAYALQQRLSRLPDVSRWWCSAVSPRGARRTEDYWPSA